MEIWAAVAVRGSVAPAGGEEEGWRKGDMSIVGNGGAGWDMVGGGDVVGGGRAEG